MAIEVKMYDALTGELIQVYDSITTASYEEDISVKAIVNNLKGITKQTKQGYVFKTDQEVGKPLNHYEVRMYDVTTNKLLQTFDCLERAAEVTGINKSTIWKNLRGIQKTVCNRKYYFRSNSIEYKPKHPEPYIQKGKSKNWLKKPIDVYDAITDELIKTFDSITEASKFIGCKTGTIGNNLKGGLVHKHQRTIYKKYYCKYHYE